MEVLQNKDLRKVVREYVDANDQELDLLFSLAEERSLRKNEMLINQGDEPSYFVFIAEGCLMTYLTDEKKQPHVLMFGFSGWWTGDIKGITQDLPSEYSIKALSESRVYLFSKEKFELLCKEAPIFERYFRKIFQNSLVTHQKRIMRQISADAEEKYRAFRARFPKLELLVAQKYIASYLGVTPEFFSVLKKRI